jgi:hypothetical protein
MSDGGAQVIVAMGEGAVQLARFKVGRVVLWFIAAWLTLSAITAHGDARPFGFFLAVAVALVALVGHFIAERRRRAERAALRNALMLIGLVAASLVGGLWLAFRKKRGDEPPPPSEEEIDALLR